MFACSTPMLGKKYDYGHVYGHIIYHYTGALHKAQSITGIDY